MLRGIVVGRDLPPDVLKRAQEEEQRRRDNASLLVQSEDDFSCSNKTARTRLWNGLRKVAARPFPEIPCRTSTYEHLTEALKHWHVNQETTHAHIQGSRPSLLR